MSDSNENYIRLMQAQLAELDQASTESNRVMMLQLERVMCDKFRVLREERGWSQKELAEKVRDYGFEFHQSTIAKLEAGTRPLRVAEMYALSHIFRLPPGAVFFMGDADDELDGFDAFSNLNRLLARQEEGRAHMREMMLEQMAQTVDIVADYQTRINEIVGLMRRIAATDPTLAEEMAKVRARHPRKDETSVAQPDPLKLGQEVIDLVRGSVSDGERQTEV